MAMGNLGLEEIEAKVYYEPKIWTKHDILVEALQKITQILHGQN